MKTAGVHHSPNAATDRVAESDQPAGSVPDSHPAGALKHLDAIVRTGERLSEAVDQLPRESLKALADRMELTYKNGTIEIRRAVKRRLLGVQR